MLTLSFGLLLGCPEPVDDVQTPVYPVPAFADGDLSKVTLSVEGTSDDGLNTPRDLQFNPDAEGELWVVNRKDDSVSIFLDAGSDDQSSMHIIDPYAFHFMEQVSSIDFGAVTYSGSDSPTFGTCQESRNTYNGQGDPNDFMGPTLWPGDVELFGTSNPDAVEYLSEKWGFYIDLGSHLDMLHESPLCMGIAWEDDNVYWVFDGSDGTIVRYDFQDDHDIGYDDHSDGLIYRYVDATVERVSDVPSHMVIDHDTDLLYTVDTGNNRITTLDITTGSAGQNLGVKENGTTHIEYTGGDYNTLIDGETVDGMERPSGIALVEDMLLVTDNKTSTIFAFDLNGELVAEIDLELDGGSLMGIEARSLSDIWLVDAKANEILRLQP